MSIKSIYIHIPFCQSKCAYCDFYSVTAHDASVRRKYLAALLVELSRLSEEHDLRRLPVQTLYIGGGTPTIFSGAEIAEFLVHVQECVALSSDNEVTIEANPGSVTAADLNLLRQAGVNRLSLGAQSFDEKKLRLLGRTHSASDTFRAVDAARDAGIKNLNLDVISALPGQSLNELNADMEQAVALSPDHISAYMLTYEENTPLFRQWKNGKLQRTDIDLEAKMLSHTVEFLESRGYMRYEIFNYCSFGKVSRHNQTYWNYENYLGVGASAASFVSPKRWTNQADVAGYIRSTCQEQSSAGSMENLDKQTQMGEMIFLALRQRQGLRMGRFEEYFGESPLRLFSETIKKYHDYGLIEIKSDHLRLTREGFMVADSIFVDFICNNSGFHE
ncbi:MAG: hypothetical protein B6244_12215 [Candidatus Cloacimonetes bacterium 4572_55]|nr:MAG: hypothetical protein B6244_12215 [Candidatus Cloacimonetes bacterium 4572_55]